MALLMGGAGAGLAWGIAAAIGSPLSTTFAKAFMLIAVAHFLIRFVVAACSLWKRSYKRWRSGA
jgi:hypothetical protein